MNGRMQTTTRESPMTTQTQAMADHLKAAGWVEHYERQLAYELRTDRPLLWIGMTRQSLRYWQRRLDAIECPEA